MKEGIQCVLLGIFGRRECGASEAGKSDERGVGDWVGG